MSLRSDLDQLFVSPETSIRDVIACIDRSRRGVALVIGPDRLLLGTVTDGDVRRAMLARLELEAPVAEVLAHKAATAPASPITALAGSSRETLLQLMRDHAVRQIPLLDENGRVTGLVTLDELMPGAELPVQAVVMAGGFGVRLRPLTEDLPKPMLPIGDRPLIERIVHQLREAGIRRVSITTHYRPEAIRDYFGNGQGFGVDISYVNEERPLGTAGALGLMPMPPGPMLVMNGDILTQVDFGAMLAYHREHCASMTVGVRQYGMQVPYGVIECEGALVQKVTEKPQLRFFVNAGIYLLEPSVHRYIRADGRFDMTDLIQCLLDAGLPVVSFPIHEYWLDIGEHGDYARAREDAQNGRVGP